MTRLEYNNGLRYLAHRYPGFDFPDETVEAWYDDLKNIPNALWFVCLKLIVREETQWWTKNLIGLVHERLDRAKAIIADEMEKIREAKEKKALPERMSPQEMEEGLAKVYETIGNKEMAE